MNNLKRVLSLALSGIMLVGMMAIGAGAVNGKDFTDKDKIQNDEAVNTLVTLNVISGKDDGSYYDPEGTLTRAEMAKLVVYVLNGGKEPVMSTKATPTYSDIGGHWAEKYIEYCSNLGIIAGQGDGTFNPGGTLTGSQAAKMMLTAMNYNSDVFHFTGPDWELSVNSEANKAGLYDELDGLDASAPISRDDAAQLVYNGMLAQTMERRWSQNMTDLQITENYQLTGLSLFNTKFGGTAYEGVLVSTGKYTLGTNPVAAYSITGTGKDKAVIALTKLNDYSLPVTIDGTTTNLGQIEDFKYTEDLSAWMGQSVKVLYNNDKKEVYGVYAVAENNATVINTMTSEVGSIKADSIKVDGTEYDTDSLQVFVNGAVGTTAALADTTADNVTFIDNDNDDKLELAIVTTVAAHEVTYVGTSSFTLGTKLAGTYATVSTSQKFDDVDTYEGMKKGDIVFVSKNLFADKDKFEKAEVTEGSINGRKGVADPYDYLIDGNWVSDEAALTNTAFSNGDTIKFVARGGLLYYTKVVSGAQSLTDVALLISVQNATKLDGNATAKLLFSDGSKKTVALKNVFQADGTTPVDTFTTPAAEGKKICGMLYKYSINSSDAYTLTLPADNEVMGDYTWGVDAASTTGYAMSDVTTAAGIRTVTDGSALDIADEAVIFLFNDGTVSNNGGAIVADSANNAKVITGKELKNLAANKVNDEIFFYTTSVTNGLSRISAAVVKAQGTHVSLDTITATSSANYGYIVSAPYTTKIDGTNYVVYPTWDGENTVNYKCKQDGIVTGVAKGEVIGFDKVDGETIKSVTHIVTTADAVTGLDGKYVKFETAPSTYTLDGDTVYLYVNSNASKSADIGQEGGALQLSSEPDSGVYVKNVKVYAVSPTQVKLVVVDTENKMAHGTNYGVTITNTASVTTADLTLTVDGTEKSVTAASTNCVRAGDVVKITNNHATKNLGFTATGTSTTSGTVAPGETVTLIATGAANLALTWATFA